MPLFGVAFVLGTATIVLAPLVAWQRGGPRAFFAVMWLLVFLWSLGLRI